MYGAVQFQRLSLSFSNVRGQCYDMAASMAGSKNDVAVKILLKSLELFIHIVMGMHLILACSNEVKHGLLLQDATRCA